MNQVESMGSSLPLNTTGVRAATANYVGAPLTQRLTLLSVTVFRMNGGTDPT